MDTYKMRPPRCKTIYVPVSRPNRGINVIWINQEKIRVRKTTTRRRKRGAREDVRGKAG